MARIRSLPDCLSDCSSVCLCLCFTRSQCLYIGLTFVGLSIFVTIAESSQTPIVYKDTYKHTYSHIHKHIYLYMCILTFAHTHIHAHTHTYTHIPIPIHTHIPIHTIYTHIFARALTRTFQRFGLQMDDSNTHCNWHMVLSF